MTTTQLDIVKAKQPREAGTAFTIEITQTVKYVRTVSRSDVIEIIAGDDELFALKLYRAPDPSLGMQLIAAHDRGDDVARRMHAAIRDNAEVQHDDIHVAIELNDWEADHV